MGIRKHYKRCVMFYAHSENDKGEKHLLEGHLRRTAELAQSFAPSSDFNALFQLAGLLHDIGKFQDGFQKYLIEGKPKTPHAGIGAYIAGTYGKQLIPLQFVIKGHHVGLPDNEERRQNNDEYAQEKDLVKIVDSRFKKAVNGLNEKVGTVMLPQDGLITECVTRFLFSALTDADWLDTERHFSPEKSDSRRSEVLDHERMLNALEKGFAQLPTEGPINRLRTNARIEAATHYAEPVGFYSLQLPTGLGKTLTSVYWALLHARHHGLKRIIVVLPYINIIDQTSSILKRILGEDVVLEHHSGMIDEDESYSREIYDGSKESAKRLACENWDSPIIVTTAVQFFESLFSNKPFKCRKNHNVANAVVIFDEIQTLPKHLAEPTIIMLRNVSAVARTSFLFCTATLPPFTKRERFDGIEKINPLIHDPRHYFDATQRVTYSLMKKLKPVNLEVVSERLLREKSSYLVVVNTKSVAKELYTKVGSEGTHEQYYHLSTAMCPHHRKRKIREISEALDPKNNRRIAVMSTQLVEAGVDFDFPCVYRAIAPLDSVIQAAGRCNRNGRAKKGKVVLFDLVDHRMPDSTYRACAAFAKGIVQDNPDVLHDSQGFERYYEQVINLFVDPDRFGITKERERFNFKTVNEQYRIIDSPTVPLLIADYSEESKELKEEVVEALKTRGFIAREEYRLLQQFSIQVFPNFLKQYGNQIETINDTLRIWLGKYDEEFGLAPEDIGTVF